MVNDAYYTERLLLVLSDEALAGKVADYYSRNRRFFTEYDPAREESFFTRQAQAELLREERAAAALGVGYRYYVFHRDGGRIIGMVGLNGIVRGAFKSCFLSYKLDEVELCRGYMTEAVGKAVEIAFDDAQLHRLEANIMPRNAASRRVVEKNGFAFEGLARKYLMINGVWEDHEHYTRLNEKLE